MKKRKKVLFLGLQRTFGKVILRKLMKVLLKLKIQEVKTSKLIRTKRKFHRITCVQINRHVQSLVLHLHLTKTMLKFINFPRSIRSTLMFWIQFSVSDSLSCFILKNKVFESKLVKIWTEVWNNSNSITSLKRNEPMYLWLSSPLSTDCVGITVERLIKKQSICCLALCKSITRVSKS